MTEKAKLVKNVLGVLEFFQTPFIGVFVFFVSFSEKDERKNRCFRMLGEDGIIVVIGQVNDALFYGYGWPKNGIIQRNPTNAVKKRVPTRTNKMDELCATPT